MVFRIADRIVWSFGSWIKWFYGSGSVFSGLSDLSGFSGSGSGFLRILDLCPVFPDFGFGVFRGLGSLGSLQDLDLFRLLIQRCKIHGDAQHFFDQYSGLPDERKICPMNV